MNEEIIIDDETLHSEIGGTWNFDSALEATLYDSEGHEIELKENHCLIIGRDAYGQIPNDHFRDATK